MASNIGSTGDKGLVCAIQISHIMCLQDQNNHPVDAHNDRVQAERGSSVIVLAPYGVIMVVLVVVVRAVKGVVNAHDDK